MASLVDFDELVKKEQIKKMKERDRTGTVDDTAMLLALEKARQRRNQKQKEMDELEAKSPPKKRYDHMGNEIDGKFTKDKVVFRWGCVVLFWLTISCSLQWAMFAIPQWRGDKYQNAGLFQVCGTVDLQFNPTFNDTGGAGNLTIKNTKPYSCESVEAYFEKFQALIAPDPNNPRPSDRWHTGSKDALKGILVSRYLEACGTFLDMVFGLGSVLLVMRPNPDERIERRNVVWTVIGLVLVPWFPTIDILVSFDYWERIGVGYFETLSYVGNGGFSNYTKLGPILSLFTSWFDFGLELWFLQWALRRLFTTHPSVEAERAAQAAKNEIPLETVESTSPSA
ncbi:hypothetical protein HDU81_008514 [Chytriomyces hyalinus]|nr:hypothetical protein HDU81_008514 [Chytriomyces hyalinus]